MGFNVAKQTIAEGQYERPKALQFGGSELYEGPRKWVGYLEKILPSVDRVVWIDFHTGLGPFGVDSLLISGDDSEEELSRSVEEMLYMTNLNLGNEIIKKELEQKNQIYKQNLNKNILNLYKEPLKPLGNISAAF